MGQCPDAHGLDCLGEQVMVVEVAPHPRQVTQRASRPGDCAALRLALTPRPEDHQPSGRIRELLKTATAMGPVGGEARSASR